MGNSWVSSRSSHHELISLLDVALDIGVQVTDAALGNIQLMTADAGSPELEIVAQRGFEDSFLMYFRRVSADDGSVCGRAMKTRRQIVIEDVNQDIELAECRDVLLGAGVVAVSSTPLIAKSGELVGMLSTQFPTKHRLSQRDSGILESLGRITADSVVAYRERQSLQAAAHLLSKREREILQLIAYGKSSSEIGTLLNISKRTVDQHVTNACEKFGAANRLQLLAFAVRDKIVLI